LGSGNLYKALITIKIKFINIYIGEEKLVNFTQAQFINAGMQNAGMQEFRNILAGARLW